MLSVIRDYFIARDFVEMETPVRIPAPAPEAHIEAPATQGWYLHTSPELCMKRLLAAGYERIFQVCRCFRSAERGRCHLPEFTLLEWYQAHQDYVQMMATCEDLVRHVVRSVTGGEVLTYQGEAIDLARPFKRISVAGAFSAFAPLTVEKALALNRFDEIMVNEIEPYLPRDQPVFLYDYPAACSALARLKPADPSVAERFELYMGGLELCNAFGELADPDEQRARFEQERRRRANAGEPCPPMPEPFLKDLARMPPAAGNALGIDRLVMLLADADCIDAVVAFTPEEL